MTSSVAVTFCSSELLPPTSKVMVSVERSYSMFKAVTVMVGSSKHMLYPSVERISPPRTLAGRALSRSRGRALHWTRVDRMAAGES